MYQTKCREIEWNATGIQSLDPRTKESKQCKQPAIRITNFKGVTKSHNFAVNVPERVEIPIKVTQLPNQNKRGRSMVTRDKAPLRAPRKERNINSKGVNANQHQVDGHQDVHLIHQMPSTNVHINNSTGTSEDPDSIVCGK